MIYTWFNGKSKATATVNKHTQLSRSLDCPKQAYCCPYSNISNYTSTLRETSNTYPCFAFKQTKTEWSSPIHNSTSKEPVRNSLKTVQSGQATTNYFEELIYHRWYLNWYKKEWLMTFAPSRKLNIEIKICISCRDSDHRSFWGNYSRKLWMLKLEFRIISAILNKKWDWFKMRTKLILLAQRITSPNWTVFTTRSKSAK